MHNIVILIIFSCVLLYIASHFVQIEIVNDLESTSSQKTSDNLASIIQKSKQKIDFDPKLQSWIETAEKVPNEFTTLKTPSITEASNILDKTIYKQRNAKNMVLGLVAKHIVNRGALDGAIIGFKGDAGVGKTTLAQHGISNTIGLPCQNIPLGGSSKQGDDLLKGHAYSYVGSHCGLILQALINAGTLNPILFFDELDKCDESAQNALINLTDRQHSHSFTDRYLGYPVDISKAVIIFAYNSSDNINPILRDRLSEITFDNYSEHDKKEITRLYSVDKMRKKYNLKIDVPSDTINTIVNSATHTSIRRTEDTLDRTISLKLVNELMKSNQISSVSLLPKDVDKSCNAEDIPQMMYS